MSNQIKISWDYKHYTPTTKREGKEPRQYTTCLIEMGNTTVQAGVGCYHKDINNRKVARKESFKKAVSTIHDRSLRTQLWQVFKERHVKCINC